MNKSEFSFCLVHWAAQAGPGTSDLPSCFRLLSIWFVSPCMALCFSGIDQAANRLEASKLNPKAVHLDVSDHHESSQVWKVVQRLPKGPGFAKDERPPVDRNSNQIRTLCSMSMCPPLAEEGVRSLLKLFNEGTPSNYKGRALICLSVS